MRYIDVEWKHESKEEPVRLVSEIGDDEFETRKLELFPNGNVGYASSAFSSEKTGLGMAPVPSLKEINEQKEFIGKSISANQFETLWQKYAPKNS